MSCLSPQCLGCLPGRIDQLTMYEFYTDAELQATLQACDPASEVAPLPSFHPEAMARLKASPAGYGRKKMTVTGAGEGGCAGDQEVSGSESTS